MAISPHRTHVVIYTRDANGDWRANDVTIVQGGTATVVTKTKTDAAGGLDALRADVYDDGGTYTNAASSIVGNKEFIAREVFVSDENFAYSTYPDG